MSKTYERLQIELAEAQLRIIKKVEEHSAELRTLERKKAEVELDTAETMNRAVKRIESANELPPIKLS